MFSLRMQVVRDFSLLCILCIASAATQAGAPPPNNATAIIDWSTLNFNFNLFPGGTNSGLFSNQQTVTDAELQDLSGVLASDFNVASGWVDLSSEINFSDPNTTAFSYARAEDPVIAGADFDSFSSLSSNITASTDSWVERSATITASGTGILLITADYFLQATVSDTSIYDASATVGFDVFVDGIGTSTFFDVFSEVFTDNFQGIDDITRTGTLAVAVAFEDGDEIDFFAFAETEVNATAPVPIPATIWLLGSGIVGLFTLRKKKL